MLNSSIVNCTFQNNFCWQWQDGGHSDEGSVIVTFNSALTLTGCTIQNNGGYHRGALVIVSSILTLSRCMIQSNDGGALFATDSILTFTENLFQDNTAENGGTFYIHTNNILMLTHNTFRNNLATSVGGSVYVQANNTLMFTENVFENNLAKNAGSVLCAANNNTLIFTENMFQDNMANYIGGAIFVDRENTLILTNNTFQKNLASKDGGVLYVNTNNFLNLTGNTFQNNSAIKSGGVLYALTNNTFTLTENTFLNNSAIKSGGVLYALTNNTFTLTENTFLNNSAIKSGGVLYVHTNNFLNLTGNTFQKSSAIFGGAADIYTYNILTLLENTFQNNSAAKAGGAIFADSNNILTITQCMFQRNSANILGGALIVDDYTAVYNVTLILKNNIFQSNLADGGGALYVRSSNIVITENTFQHNTVNTSGGVIYIHHNSTIAIMKNTFKNNYAGLSGGCLTSFKNNTITFTENILISNIAGFGGVVSVSQNSTLTIIRNCFHNNVALNGGVLYTHYSITYLINNTFSNNRAQLMGGVIFSIARSNLSIQSQHRLWNNTAQYGGGVAAIDSQVTLAGNTSFENNTATYGGGLYADGSQLLNNGWTHFMNNSATKDGGGAYASRSELRSELITAQGFTFQENSALNNGGGVMLTGGSKIYLQPNTYLIFTSNSSKQKGGALMIQESDSVTFCAELSCKFLTGTECFFQIQTQANYDTHTPISEITELHNVRFYFKNNTALEAGATLYGSSIDYCRLTCVNQHGHVKDRQSPYDCPISGKIFEHIASNESLDISSDPLYICLCNDNETVCSSCAITTTVYPGGIVTVPVLAHGQRNGTTPAVIHNITPKDSLSFNDLEITQNIPAGCTSLKYTVHTRAENTFQQIRLYAEGPCPPRERTTLATPTNILTIGFKVAQCPPGFELSDTHPTCICTQRLQRFTNDCQINDRTIKRGSEFWMGYTDDGDSKGLILHSHCPFDYCSSNTMYLKVNNSDKQCSNNRSGLLCG